MLGSNARLARKIKYPQHSETSTKLLSAPEVYMHEPTKSRRTSHTHLGHPRRACSKVGQSPTVIRLSMERSLRSKLHNRGFWIFFNFLRKNRFDHSINSFYEESKHFFSHVSGRNDLRCSDMEEDVN